MDYQELYYINILINVVVVVFFIFYKVIKLYLPKNYKKLIYEIQKLIPDDETIKEIKLFKQTNIIKDIESHI